MIGGDETAGIVLQVFIGLVFVTGIVLALIWRRTRPSVYSRIGGEEDTVSPLEESTTTRG